MLLAIRQPGLGPCSSALSAQEHPSFADVTAKSPPESRFAEIVAKTVTQTLDQRQHMEKEKRTIVAVNVPQDKAMDDPDRARLLCSTVNPNVVVQSVHRDRPLSNFSNRTDLPRKTYFGPGTRRQSDAAQVQITAQVCISRLIVVCLPASIVVV